MTCIFIRRTKENSPNCDFWNSVKNTFSCVMLLKRLIVSSCQIPAVSSHLVSSLYVSTHKSEERHDDINNVRVAPPPASSQTRPHGSNCERDPGRKWRDLSMLISLETNRCVSPYLEAYGDSESAVKRAAAKYAAAGVCKRWLGRFMHAEMGSVHQVQAGDLEKKKHSSGGISAQNVEKTCFWSHLKYVCGADHRIRAFPVKS